MAQLSVLRILLVCALLSLCSAARTANPDDCYEKDQCREDVDGFSEDEKIEIKYAKKTILEVKYFNRFVQFVIRGAEEDQRYSYQVYPCGCIPNNNEEFGNRQVLYTRTNKLFVNEHPIIAAIFAIDEEYVIADNYVKYYTTLSDVYEPKIRAEINNANIKLVVPEGTFIPDYTSITKDNVAASVIGSFGFKAYIDNVEDVPYLISSESNEVEPLARAEWIKIFGLIMGKAKEANELFDNIVTAYTKADSEATKKANSVTSLFFSIPFKNGNGRYDWFLPSKDQYPTDLARDAITSYRYAETSGPGAINNSISEVVKNFGSARHLIHGDLFPPRENPTLKDFIDSFDPSLQAELRKFRAVQCGNVWYTQLTDTDGASDRFGSAIVRPDEYLGDIVKLAHPELDFPKDFVFMNRYPKPEELDLPCTYPSIPITPAAGKEIYEKTFVLSGKTWFEVEDLLSPNLVAAMKRKKITEFDLWWKPANREEDIKNKRVTVTVATLINSKDNETFNESPNVFDAMKEVYTDVSGAGGGSSGLGAGAIIGIILAIIVVCAILFFLWKRRKTTRSPVPPGPGEYWDGDEADGGGAGPQAAGPFDGAAL